MAPDLPVIRSRALRDYSPSSAACSVLATAFGLFSTIAAVQAGRAPHALVVSAILAVVLGVIVSWCSADGRRPPGTTWPDDEELARRFGEVRSPSLGTLGQARQMALVGTVPATLAVTAALVVVRPDVTGNIGIILAILAAVVAAGIITSAGHFVAVAVAFLAAAHGRWGLTVVMLSVLVGFDLVTVWRIAAEPSTWGVAFDLIGPTVAGWYILDVTARLPRVGWATTGVVAAVSAAIRREVAGKAKRRHRLSASERLQQRCLERVLRLE